jgi:predicted NBD/HSP70 family sugar kinase
MSALEKSARGYMQELQTMPNVTRKTRKPNERRVPRHSVSNGKAGKEAASSELAREINRDVILELIRLHQPVSRVQLSRVSGLQNSTVSSIVEQLLAEGWIGEGEALRTARGRRPTQISLNSRLAMLVADVHLGRAVVAAVDLNGHVLDNEEITLAHEVGAGVEDLSAGLQRLRMRHAERTFTGAGVCLPGRVDRGTGQLILAPNLNWYGYDIQKAIAARLKMSVELENDANACLLAELWFGNLNGIRDAVLLAISEGVGASLLCDGNLVDGRMGMAGEVGHICYDPVGPLCGCGRRGCWEVFASSTAALRYYRELAPRTKVTKYTQLAQLAGTGDPQACAALERQAQAIGRGLRIVTAALDPQIILFTGEISLGWPIVRPILETACQNGMLSGSPPVLSCTGVADVSHLRGAAAVVLQRHSTYYRSRSDMRTASSQAGASRRP